MFFLVSGSLLRRSGRLKARKRAFIRKMVTPTSNSTVLPFFRPKILPTAATIEDRHQDDVHSSDSSN